MRRAIEQSDSLPNGVKFFAWALLAADAPDEDEALAALAEAEGYLEVAREDLGRRFTKEVAELRFLERGIALSSDRARVRGGGPPLRPRARARPRDAVRAPQGVPPADVLRTRRSGAPEEAHEGATPRPQAPFRRSAPSEDVGLPPASHGQALQREDDEEGDERREHRAEDEGRGPLVPRPLRPRTASQRRIPQMPPQNAREMTAGTPSGEAGVITQGFRVVIPARMEEGEQALVEDEGGKKAGDEALARTSCRQLCHETASVSRRRPSVQPEPRGLRGTRGACRSGRAA